MASVTSSSTPLLIICGPTATGKTSLALHLAELLKGDLISCDSRQVYTHMNVITGKDIPPNFTKQDSGLSTSQFSVPIYTNHQTNIWGYDLVNPNQEFSVAHYLEFFHTAIAFIRHQSKLPILVGGTGYYLQSLLHPPATLFIPPNPVLRQQLQSLTPEQLFSQLQQLNPAKAERLTPSERGNRHRLIRAIEIATAAPISLPDWFTNYQQLAQSFNVHAIGLHTESSSLYTHIDQRVDLRQTPAMEQELDFLTQNNFLSGAPSHTIGYQQMLAHRQNLLSLSDAIQQWKFAEHAYARRQMTWFKRQAYINWFDIRDTAFQQQIVKQVQQWYSKPQHG